MNTDNRVLGRRGARELTPSETDHVAGGIHTLTKCSFAAGSSLDGDVGECGH